MSGKFWKFTVALLAGISLSGCDQITEPGNRAQPASQANFDIIGATGLTKPVNGLREYNGTYYGSPGTGSIGYTTLYRDNYGAPNGWEGEGSGKHSGVDIPVPSGSRVYAAEGGQVVYSYCGADGFGGRITIRVPNRYVPGRYVYYTYAHLRTRRFALHDWVSAGDSIGTSGGASGDACRGNSTGAHLHFQIDNDNDSSYPYGPTNTNTPDTNYEVTGATYNPMVYIQGGYRWGFDQDGNDELWKLSNVAAGGVGGGWYGMDGNADPFLSRSGNNVSCGRPALCSTQIAAEASLYKIVRVHIRIPNCNSLPSKVYFRTSSDANWDEAKSVEIPVPYGPYQDYNVYQSVNMSVNPKWTGIITSLRVDPVQNCNSSVSDPLWVGYVQLVS